MFKVFYLSYCGYSKKTLETLETLKIKNIIKNYELIECDDRTKLNSDTDSEYIPTSYTTYPKVLFKTNDKIFFIGGNQEFQKILSLLYELKKNSNAEITNQKYIKDKKDICYILLKLLK
jgi:glutaredoxin